MKNDLLDFVEFYSSVRKNIDFNLDDLDLMLKFETYLELRLSNVLLLNILFPKPEQKDEAIEFYFDQLYKSRTDMLGNYVEKGSRAARGFF
jgi:hypothetical protein